MHNRVLNHVGAGYLAVDYIVVASYLNTSKT